MQKSPLWQAICRSSLPGAGSFLGKLPRLGAASTRQLLQRRSKEVPNQRRRLFTTLSSAPDGSKEIRKEIKQRTKQIEESGIDVYPRYLKDEKEMSLLHFIRKFYDTKIGIASNDENDTQVPVVVSGRVRSIRLSGKRLAFIDIVGDQGHKLQALYNFGPLERKGVTRNEFTRVKQLLRRGDSISIKGYPHRTDSGELSIKAIELPKILSPCLHDFPAEKTLQKSTTDQEHEWPGHNRHVEMLVNPDIIRVIVQRSQIISNIRKFFTGRQYIEVQTPVLAAAAGGASARSFETTATEFPEKRLALRVAPELWLKRLIVGGMPRVFEIGPSFRNEGLDRTHNPEFTTCEFYSAFTSLSELISTTEALLLDLSTRQHKSYHDKVNRQGKYEIKAPGAQEMPYPPSALEGPYPQVDFIPALNEALNTELPNLSEPNAETLTALLVILESNSVAIPEQPTLPRLLDKLSSTFLESKCEEPTWIVNIPECMSPLSKTFIHPTAPNHQSVAARAELFVNKLELVNCYEEENNPFEQRRKFKMQAIYASKMAEGERLGALEVDPEAMKLDEDYLRALEWGLPPTGGWGCGIDRLVMLFAGRERIGDVLTFGNLRAVARSAEKWKQDDVELSSSDDVEKALDGEKPL